MIILFYTLTKLQGSQTKNTIDERIEEFYTLTKLQGSQTFFCSFPVNLGFTLLQNYKVLKPQIVITEPIYLVVL